MISAPNSGPLPVDKNGVEATALEGVRSQWVDITPAKAAKWLKNNFGNRPVSEDVVIAYARDMATGQWVATHQGIAFNDHDELIDGQHRLLAIVKSGVTVRMMVTFGLPAIIPGKEMTTMDCVDRGRPRSVSDQLKIQHGLKDGHLIAQIANVIANVCFEERTRRLSVGQCLDIYRAFEPAMKWVMERRSKQFGLRGAGVLGGFAFALMPQADALRGLHFNGDSPAESMRVKLPAIAQLFEQLNSGDARKGGAIAKLRDFLLGDDARLITRSFNGGIAELTLNAIRLELQGKPVKELAATLEGAEHFRALQKDRVEKIANLFRLPKS